MKAHTISLVEDASIRAQLRRMAWRIALHWRRPSDVDDVFQELCFGFWKLEKADRNATMKKLFGCAKNEAIKFLSRGRSVDTKSVDRTRANGGRRTMLAERPLRCCAFEERLPTETDNFSLLGTINFFERVVELWPKRAEIVARMFLGDTQPEVAKAYRTSVCHIKHELQTMRKQARELS